jgi:hypothetical protein
VSTWDRTNRLELELLQAKRVYQDNMVEYARVLTERDRARATAAMLEAECAELVRHVEHLTATLDDIVMVPVIGPAS